MNLTWVIFQGTLFVGCLELGVGRRWINTQGVVVFGVFDHFGFGCFSLSLELADKIGQSAAEWEGGRILSRYCRGWRGLVVRAN